MAEQEEVMIGVPGGDGKTNADEKKPESMTVLEPGFVPNSAELNERLATTMNNTPEENLYTMMRNATRVTKKRTMSQKVCSALCCLVPSAVENVGAEIAKDALKVTFNTLTLLAQVVELDPKGLWNELHSIFREILPENNAKLPMNSWMLRPDGHFV